jgi:hypothetical protein
LQRLGRDGWLDVQHGKSTRVTDYWRQGGLNVLNALVRHAADLPEDFVPNLLEVRLAMAPVYTYWAVNAVRPYGAAAVSRVEDSSSARFVKFTDLETPAVPSFHDFERLQILSCPGGTMAGTMAPRAADLLLAQGKMTRSVAQMPEQCGKY